MNVTTVSASVRYSNGTKGGPFTTIELGAEAALSPNEQWQEAQAKLYTELGQQLKALWPAKANGQATNGNGQAEHHCTEHDTAFKRHERDGETWYSHKQGQSWCNEGR